MHHLFKYAHHLGFNNPYYYKEGQKLSVEPKFESIMSESKTTKTVNPKALLSFFNKFYFLGDDCIVNETKRSPWMAKPNPEQSDWDYFELPQHQNKKRNEEEVAEHSFELLCEVIKDYLGKPRKISKNYNHQ